MSCWCKSIAISYCGPSVAGSLVPFDATAASILSLILVLGAVRV